MSIAGAWVLGAAALTWGSMASAELGVAFVHGTGAQTNATHEYWTEEFVTSVAAGLPDPGVRVVINCNLGAYMWTPEAAGCVASQLTSFIDKHQIDRLVVVTHSNGGNVMRWILSNPTWDPRYPELIDKIAWVDALAPSSLGTPLADAVIEGNTFETTAGWLLGYDDDAVVQQQVGHMAYYNANWLMGTAGRPELPVGFWAVVGTDVHTNPLDADSQCGGYHLGAGLELTQNWLDECSDGFLECASQAGAGEVWFYDAELTEQGEPLSHAQSRRACFGLDRVLRDDVATLTQASGA